MLDKIAAFSPDNSSKYPGYGAGVSKIHRIRGATSSVDRALVSGTKGPGFDPRVALHQVPKIIRIVIFKNRIPTVSEAPFEGPFLFGPSLTFESKVELHCLSIF